MGTILCIFRTLHNKVRQQELKIIPDINVTSCTVTARNSNRTLYIVISLTYEMSVSMHSYMQVQSNID